MQILIAAATKFEIAPTIQLLETSRFSFNHHEITILITGVGPVAATYMLARHLQARKPDLVIQAGIAGSFSIELSPGETVLIKQDTFGDLGTEEKGIFFPLFDTGLTNKNDFPFSDGWLVNDYHLLTAAGLPTVKAVTVNKVSDSLVQKQQLVNHFSPQVETMEGAALHYVCMQEHTSFIQIRTISNEVGERDKNKWKIKEAIDNLNTALQKLMMKL